MGIIKIFWKENTLFLNTETIFLPVWNDHEILFKMSGIYLL